MKLNFITICLLLLCTGSFAQETIERSQKLTKKITEVYHVLQSDPNIKHGLYQARHDKKIALASGLYAHNKRVGVWHFFDYAGNLLQNYNYDQNLLTYEAPDDSGSRFKYLFDKKVISTDVLTKPVKIGGRFFGYINYMKVFKKPADADYEDLDRANITIELLISPGGHLAAYTIHVRNYNYNNDLSVNIDLLSEEDKTFIPATLNNEPVSARIVIPCQLDRNFELMF